MAQQKKQGFLNRLIVGSEKSEGYARGTLPSNRYELFWDIFKGRFKQIILLNLMLIFFFIPLFALYYFKFVTLNAAGATEPFSQNIGIGYPSIFYLKGYDLVLTMQADFQFYLTLLLTMPFIALGVSGGFYVFRNLVWTENVFISSDFWKGIRTNYLRVLIICALYTLFFGLIFYGISAADYFLITGSGSSFYFSFSKVTSYIILVLFSIMTLYMLTLTVTYKLSFFRLVKNSFLLTIALLPQNLLFFVLALLPVILLLVMSYIPFLMFVIVILFLLFGFSFLILLWTDFSHYVFDRFINDKVENAVKNRGIYEKQKAVNTETLNLYKTQKHLQNSYFNNPVKPITDKEISLAELPASYTRKDLEKLIESKKLIDDDSKKWADEHKNDGEESETDENIDTDNLSGGNAAESENDLEKNDE